MALKACPQPPDISSILIWVMFMDCLSFSVRYSGVMGGDEDAAISAASVSVCAAIGGELLEEEYGEEREVMMMGK